MASFEKTYSAQETAQILGLCLDSVRRHFRSGQLPGIRVGREWRITQSQLEAYIGVTPSTPETCDAQPDLDVHPTLDIQLTPSPKPEDEIERGNEREAEERVVTVLLRTGPVRDQIGAIVRQAAANAYLPPDAKLRLLTELNLLLRGL